MPKSCSAPRCQTGYYNDHSGIPVFQMPSNSPDIEQKWRNFLHRDGKPQLYKLPFVDIKLAVRLEYILFLHSGNFTDYWVIHLVITTVNLFRFVIIIYFIL